MDDKVLGHLREARAILNDETKAGQGSRESSLAITKIDEAILWRQEGLRMRTEPINTEKKN